MDLFKDNVASTKIGDLTVETSAACVSLYGSVDLTRDKRGLAAANALAELVDHVRRELMLAEASNDLPEVLPDLPSVARKGPLFPK